MKSIGKIVIVVLLSLCVSAAYAEVRVGAGSTAGPNSLSISQQQSQGQAIEGSGNSSVHDSGNSSVQFKDSFNGADPIRYPPVPTHVHVDTGGGPQIFGSPDYADRGPHFMSMLVLVNALNNIDMDEVSPNDDGDIEIVGQMINALEQEEKDAIKDQDVMFYLNEKGDVTKQFPDFKMISVATLKSKDEATINSATLAVKLRQYADEVGGKKIVLVSEGTSKKLSSWGVGVGLSYNMASVDSKPDGSGSVGSGGTGWSWGESEYFSLPYLTAIIGY